MMQRFARATHGKRATSAGHRPTPRGAGASDERDRAYMRDALALAGRASGRTAPNPMVGAIVVGATGRIAAGLHTRPGRAHAEAVALRKAGARARGATLYVTLEPCAHDGRTPPCVDAVLASGVRRVVIGTLDPDPRTAGRSAKRLRRAGLDVRVGVLRDACRALNAGFESRVRRGRPFTIVKLAASLDGRVATHTGESRWITGPAARAFVHALRARVDAIAVGSRTARIDDPELVARRGGRVVHAPTRIVVDSQLRLPVAARMLDGAQPGQTWVLGARGASARRRNALTKAGARVVDVAARGAHLDLRAAWAALGALGVNELLVEGGGELAAALLRAGLVDRLHVFLAPMLIGADGVPVLGVMGVARLDDAARLGGVVWRKLGDDLLMTADLAPSRA
jgi:diaminohydroxyphosphoribosylaminopyrimidine deaminase/5-amino-6-(5-phosphoribosylamino)uracil reductase